MMWERAAARDAVRLPTVGPAEVIPFWALQMAIENGCAWLASAWLDVRASPGWADRTGDHEPGGRP
jgi:hypothetical protein